MQSSLITKKEKGKKQNQRGATTKKKLVQAEDKCNDKKQKQDDIYIYACKASSSNCTMY